MKNDVIKWVVEWVSVYNENLDAIPCPFAKQALIDGKIEWVEASGIDAVTTRLDMVPAGLPCEVLVIIIDPEHITAKELSAMVRRYNRDVLMPAGYVALEDHPYEPEIIAGEKMNQGTWALILIQETEKLNRASKMLEKSDYYKKWTKENIDDVVTWRKS